MSKPRGQTHLLATGLGFFLIIAAPVALLLYIHAFDVSVVYLDEWDFVRRYRLFAEHVTTLHQFLFAQHNEHILVVPMLFFIGLVEWFKYNLLVSSYFGWGLLAFIALIGCVMANQRKPETVPISLAIAPVVLIAFNLRQWENFITSYSVPILLVSLLTITMVWLNDRVTKIGIRFWLAVASALLATFTYLNGLLLWPIGFVQLAANVFFKPEGSKPNKGVVPLLCWTFVGLASVWYFFTHYTITLAKQAASRTAAVPLSELVSFFLQVLANPLAHGRHAATVVGAIYLAVCALFVYLAFKWKRCAFDLVAPCMLILYQFGSAIFITGGRMHEHLPLSSRYSSMLGLGVIGLYIALLRLQRNQPTRKPLLLAPLCALIALIVFNEVFNTSEALIIGKLFRTTRTQQAQLLKNYRTETAADLLPILGGRVFDRADADFLADRKLNVFSQ